MTSYNFNLTLNDLVTTAYQQCNIYQAGDAISSEDYNLAVLLLNAMILDWEKDSIKLWKRRQGVLFTQNKQNAYAMGATGDNTCNTFVQSALTTLVSSGTSLTLVSTGMTIGDYIGIKLDNGNRQWTTIATIPNSTSVTISNAITSQASINNSVVSYTTKINRPLRILRGTVYDMTNGSEQVIDFDTSYDAYLDQPQKNTAGRPNVGYYDKLLDNGVVYLFPTPNVVDQIIKFTYQDSLLTMINSNDNFDFPQEWFMTLLYGLIVELLYSQKMFIELQAYEPKAEKLKAKAATWDGDEQSLKISTSKKTKK